jgi:hypothetical protein
MKLSLADAPHTAATQFGTWISYAGSARTALALVLLAAAAIAAYLGFRLRLPVRPPRPGQVARGIMLTTWVGAIVAFLLCVSLYIQQLASDHLLKAAPADAIAPVTFGGVVILFALLATTSKQPRGVRWGSAAIAALAAPMVFELPFDLIIMARTYPPVAPDPALYRALFFVPLVLIELSTLALLSLSPVVTVTRATCWCFALMLAVFAIWSLEGFSYPSAPVPILLNALSKIIAFVTTLTLFLPLRGGASAQAEDREPNTAMAEVTRCA